MNFHVMQPGSSVATSLVPGEAVPKHVAILSVTGRDFKVESIRLKSVRPFVMKEIVLSEDKEARAFAKKDNRTILTTFLVGVVERLIEQAKEEWLEVQEGTEQDDELEVPLPLIRLRVEYSAPESGGNFDCENPQRFSNRFVGKVANVNDVIQFYRKKAGVTRKTQDGAELPEESIIAQLSIDSVKVEKLVREFLTAQSLTILPQNSFGDAVSQFVDKDDKHAMEIFVNDSLLDQIKNLMDIDHAGEDIQNAMDEHKSKLEELFAAGRLKRTKRSKLKPRPANWDSDLDGEWAAQPGALIRSDVDDAEDDDEATLPSTTATTTGRGRGRGKATGTKRTPAAAKKTAPTKNARSKNQEVEEESEEEDVVMISDEDESQLFVQPAKPTRAAKKPAAPKRATSPAKRAPARGASGAASKQSKLAFSQSTAQPSRGGRALQEVSDEISDDGDDAFEPAPSTARSTRSRR